MTLRLQRLLLPATSFLIVSMVLGIVFFASAHTGSRGRDGSGKGQRDPLPGSAHSAHTTATNAAPLKNQSGNPPGDAPLAINTLILEAFCQSGLHTEWSQLGFNLRLLKDFLKSPTLVALIEGLKNNPNVDEQISELYLRSASDVKYLAYAAIVLMAPQSKDLQALLFGTDSIHGDPTLKALRLWGLSKVGTPEALLIVSEALSTSYAENSTELDRTAAYALANAGPAGLETLGRQTELLIRKGALTSERAAKQAQCLALCDDPMAVNYLRTTLANHELPLLRAMAAASLLHLGTPEDVLAVGSLLKSEKDPHLQSVALNPLIEMGVFGELLGRPESTNEQIRTIIEESSVPAYQKLLVGIQLTPETAALEARRILFQLPPARPDDESIRKNLCKWLVKGNDRCNQLVYEYVISQGTSIDDSSLQALSWMKEIDDPAVVKTLLSCIERNPTKKSRGLTYALDALSRIPEEKQPEVVDSLMSQFTATWSPETRLKIVDKLDAFGERGADHLQILATEDRDPLLQFSALASLSRLRDSPRARSTLIEYFKGTPSPLPLHQEDQRAHYIGEKYVEMFKHTFLTRRANREDLPYLQAVAASGEIPILNVQLEQLEVKLRSLARTAIEMIELRELVVK